MAMLIKSAFAKKHFSFVTCGSDLGMEVIVLDNGANTIKCGSTVEPR